MFRKYINLMSCKRIKMLHRFALARTGKKKMALAPTFRKIKYAD